MSSAAPDIRAWFPFYTGDYLADTQGFTTEQHGAYVLLLIYGWRHEGAVPASDRELATITGLSAARWAKHAPVLLSKWRRIDGTYVNRRLCEEIERAKSVSQRRKEAGAKGGRPKSNSLPNAFYDETNRLANEKLLGKQNESKTKHTRDVNCPERVAETFPSQEGDSTTEEVGSARPLAEVVSLNGKARR